MRVINPILQRGFTLSFAFVEVVFDVPASPNNTLELHHAHAQQPSDVTSASGALASLVSQTVSNPANLHVRSPSDG